MMTREKVIKGLECCVRHFGECDSCPYDMGRGNCGCGKQLYADALTLLKTQEPRVLSLEETRDSFVIEYHYSGKIRKVGDELTVDDDCREYYNRVWRIWDHMPTDEERMAAPWT